LPDCIIDGEVCAVKRARRSGFRSPAAALAAGDSKDLVFFAFDMLFTTEDLRGLPLAARKSDSKSSSSRSRKKLSDRIRYLITS